MNLGLYNKLMKLKPSQNPTEWEMFLEVCDIYLRKRKIKNPVVVELGVLWNRQKPFYEQLLGAEHIGIDSEDSRGVPDIKGFTHDAGTINTLTAKLNGRSIDILFIDASHRYNWVKKDFELYSPLSNGIIAFHDIETGYKEERHKHQVWRLWNELLEESYVKEGRYKDYMFLSIRQCRRKKNRSGKMGIGLMMKNPIIKE